MNKTSSIILASSSPYRRKQLTQLGLTFACVSPQIDESPLPGEPPEALAYRLANAKAAEVLAHHPDALIIGSDQVAELGQRILGKPLTTENARGQLSACSNNQVTFYTAVCIASATKSFTEVVTTDATFLPLSPAAIDEYIEREQPLDCAGSFKCEGLGIALFTSISSADPTALVGLPLIAVNRLLSRHGFDILPQNPS